MKIKFRIIRSDEIAKLLGINILAHPFLTTYLRDRPEILDRIDIFCPNSRSEQQVYKNFDLFEEVTGTADVLVCSIYLELFEYTGHTNLIRPLVEKLTERYPHDRLIFQWNHDNDFFPRFKWFQEFPNVYVIQFNTSHALPNDILVPFWTINTHQISEPKQYFAGFAGAINSKVRTELFQSISNQFGYYVLNTTMSRSLDEQTFLKLISSFHFNFCPRGTGLSSYRFYETFHVGSIPVLLADDAQLPFADKIDYSSICVRIPEAKASNFIFIDKSLRAVDNEQVLKEIARVRDRFSLLGVQEQIYERLSR